MPSIKQVNFARKVSEIIRNNGEIKPVTLGKLLSESGYAPEVCKKPKLVTESKGVKALMEKEFGNLNQHVATEHLFLINQYADLSVKCKAIDLYYKLTGKYLNHKSDSEFDKKVNEALDYLSNVLSESTSSSR